MVTARTIPSVGLVCTCCNPALNAEVASWFENGQQVNYVSVVGGIPDGKLFLDYLNGIAYDRKRLILIRSFVSEMVDQGCYTLEYLERLGKNLLDVLAENGYRAIYSHIIPKGWKKPIVNCPETDKDVQAVCEALHHIALGGYRIFSGVSSVPLSVSVSTLTRKPASVGELRLTAPLHEETDLKVVETFLKSKIRPGIRPVMTIDETVYSPYPNLYREIFEPLCSGIQVLA